MTRADWVASVPKCDRSTSLIGDGNMPPCSSPMWWTADPFAEGEGVWVCRKHGPQLTGVEAAERGGFLASRIVVET